MLRAAGVVVRCLESQRTPLVFSGSGLREVQRAFAAQAGEKPGVPKDSQYDKQPQHQYDTKDAAGNVVGNPTQALGNNPGVGATVMGTQGANPATDPTPQARDGEMSTAMEGKGSDAVNAGGLSEPEDLPRIDEL